MAKKIIRDTGLLVATVIGDGLFIRPSKTKKVFRKRKNPVKVKAPGPRGGCRLTGVLYDQEANRTTFMYECDHKVAASGSNSYTVTKNGNYF